MTTPLLGAAEIAEGVANQTTLHNQALRQLEARLVRALSMTTTAPPAAIEGDSYIIPAGATGAWAGKGNQVASLIGGGWSYYMPIEGVRLWVNDADAEYVFDGAAWIANGGDASADIATAISAHLAAGDPHPQYLTQSEADALYKSASAPSAVTSVNTKTGAVTLSAADVGADAAGAASSAVSAHVAAADPHGQYALESTIGQANGIASLGSDGKVPAAQLPASATTGGTVTSVALTTPGLLFDVAGSPVTTNGTLAMTLKAQVKNTFLAGPASGADAAPTMRALTAADLPAQPFDVTAFYPGVPSASAIVTRVPVARAVIFPAGLTGSIGKASVAATGSTAFDVQKNGASVGTITFAASATSATFTAASAITLAAGDVLSIVAPSTADATLANVGIVLAGTR